MKYAQNYISLSFMDQMKFWLEIILQKFLELITCSKQVKWRVFDRVRGLREFSFIQGSQGELMAQFPKIVDRDQAAKTVAQYFNLSPEKLYMYEVKTDDDEQYLVVATWDTFRLLETHERYRTNIEQVFYSKFYFLQKFVSRGIKKRRL